MKGTFFFGFLLGIFVTAVGGIIFVRFIMYPITMKEIVQLVSTALFVGVGSSVGGFIVTKVFFGNMERLYKEGVERMKRIEEKEDDLTTIEKEILKRKP